MVVVGSAQVVVFLHTCALVESPAQALFPSKLEITLSSDFYRVLSSLLPV